MGFLKPKMHVRDIYSIDLDDLREKGYCGILLDLDNTFIPYGIYEPIPDEAMQWLREVQEKGFKVAIYSNASKWKVDLVNKQTGLFGVHKAIKPLHLKLKRCLDYLELDKSKVIAIGDQLFTDILGCNIAGIYTILVEPTHPRDFWGTKILRFLERCAGRKPLEEQKIPGK